MQTHAPNLAALALVFISALTVLPLSVKAQAGLSGNALEGQMEEMRGSNFGSNNQSALGQLEAISGGKVDRSSTQRTTTTRTVQQPRPSAPRVDTNQMLKQQFTGALAGALVGALFSNLLNDNSAAQRQAQAEAEARARAEAAAQAEALRVQQELARQARIRQAQHYRAEWDARETDIANRLGGAFALHPGTAFFGQPANPDAATIAELSRIDNSGTEPSSTAKVPAIADSDPSVVDLSDSSLVVNPIRGGIIAKNMPTRSSGSLMPRWAYEWAEPPPRRRDPSELEQLLAYFGPWLGKWYKETVAEGAIKSTLWGLAKRKSQYFGENMAFDYGQGLYSFHEQRTDLTETLGGRAEKLIGGIVGGHATDAAYALADPNSNGGAYIEEDARFFGHLTRKLKADTYETTAEQMFGHFEMPDANELKSPSVDYNFTPVRKITHVDEARVNNLLFGPLKNTSKTVSHRSINGLPGSYGSPPALD